MKNHIYIYIYNVPWKWSLVFFPSLVLTLAAEQHTVSQAELPCNWHQTSWGNHTYTARSCVPFTTTWESVVHFWRHCLASEWSRVANDACNCIVQITAIVTEVKAAFAPRITGTIAVTIEGYWLTIAADETVQTRQNLFMIYMYWFMPIGGVNKINIFRAKTVYFILIKNNHGYKTYPNSQTINNGLEEMLSIWLIN